MPQKPKLPLDRRRFLRGLGLSLAIPALESLRPAPIKAADGDRPKARNFVCVAPDYGLNPEGFFPQQDLNSILEKFIRNSLDDSHGFFAIS